MKHMQLIRRGTYTILAVGFCVCIGPVGLPIRELTSPNSYGFDFDSGEGTDLPDHASG
jgi:hypothetical protein